LSSICSRLGLDRAQEEEITRELATHIEECIQDHRRRGLTGDEAEQKAIGALGEPGKISRQLKWVHGFGRSSNRPWIDALLGSLPFGLALLGICLRLSFPLYLWWSIVIGVSVYALKEAVPAWTASWLGLAHLLVLFFLFNGTYGGMRFLLGYGWAASYSLAFLSTAVVLFGSTFLLARKKVELTLLFLLPLTALYVAVGFEDVAPSHRFFIALLVLVFAFVYAFSYLLNRCQRPVLFAAIGFVVYNALYLDVMRTAPAPLDSTGMTLLGLRILIYTIPLTLISSPVCYYFKRRAV
jgi:hypothetical protein